MTLAWPGMYRVITVSLVALVGLSALMSGLGLVGFSPLGILVTAALAITSTWLVSALGSLLGKFPLHHESSVITGLLITLIVPPTLEARDIIGASVAGALAGASKWLIAPHRRHVLNPAATGVLIASLLGLTVGFWWVATPWLTPLIILAGGIVAFRSGHLSTAGWFLALALPLLIGRLLLAGEPLGPTLWLALTSYPLLFMGLFMVTEPLTMATRRFDRFLVAVAMAIPAALPFGLNVGPVSVTSSPELALVIGNVVAWSTTSLRAVRRQAGLAVHEVIDITDTVREYRFTADRPLVIEPGQWVELQLPHRRPDSRGSRRVMSVSRLAPADEASTWTFAVTTRHTDPGSSWKRALSALEPGDSLRLTQVGGDFLPPHAIVGHLVMVSGGVGITPFAAQLFAAADRELGIEGTLIVVPSVNGEELYPELSHVRGVRRVVVGSVDQIASALPADLDDVSWAGVSGSPAFVQDARKVLEQAGLSRVHTDRFIGY